VHILRSLVLAAAAALLLSMSLAAKAAPFRPVPPSAVAQDTLIRAGEAHFAHLWQLTFGGQNAEAYWSGDGTKLIWQWTGDEWKCDQQYVMDLKTGARTRVSTGKGRTTCGYFYDKDRRVLFASTHLGADSCPPTPDMSQGYVWPVYSSYELFTAKPDGSDLERLTDHDGYDAEATLSVDGKWIVFTSKRDDDVDLYKMRPDGSGLVRLTNSLGYDGGAYFSHDGKRIVWRTYRTDDTAANHTFSRLLAQDLVKPTKMDLWVMNADGSNQRRVSFGEGRYSTPVWSPRGDLIAFTRQQGGRFAIGVMRPDGSGERILTESYLDEAPTWSPNGRVIMFFREDRGAGPQLWSVDLTGRNLRRIPTQTDASDPAWSPLLP